MNRSLILLAVMLLGWALCAQAPDPGGAPPAGQGRPPRLGYEASKEATLQGTVTAVTLATRGRGAFVTLAFLAGGTSYEVLAGPEEVLKRLGLTLAKDDVLTIVGAPLAGPDGARFLARTLTKGDLTVTLLDAEGRPTGRP